MPWFENQSDAWTFVEQTAREVIAGERDAYEGGADIWHTAMLLHDAPEWDALLPFAELTDALERQDIAPEEVAQGKIALRDAAQFLLDRRGEGRDLA